MLLRKYTSSEIDIRKLSIKINDTRHLLKLFFVLSKNLQNLDTIFIMSGSGTGYDLSPTTYNPEGKVY
jgi:hypothetical protein